MEASRKIWLVAGVLCVVVFATSSSRAAADDEIGAMVQRILTDRREDLDPVVNRLVYLASPRAASEIASLLHHPSPHVRAKAVWVLGFLDAPAARQALHQAVLDPFWEVRRDAVFALGTLSAKGSASRIATRLEDPERQVRLEAVRVLGLLKEPATAPALRRALESLDDDDAMEIALLTALGSLGDQESLSVVRERLAHDVEEVRLAALRTLARLGDDSAQSELLRRLGHVDPATRRDAALLLADVPLGEVIERLAGALAREDDPWVALAMAEALAAHGHEAGLRHLAVASAGASDPRLAQRAVEALARLGIKSEELAAVRRRMAAERLRASDLPIEALAADLVSLGLPFHERLLALSERFLGVRYMAAPLGEGAGVDPGPLYRWDAVDCLTFVEQVLALAHAPEPDAVLPILIDVRYQGARVAFGERNHLMEHQWLPNNILKGWLRDVTREVGGDLVKVARKEITTQSWERRRGVDLPLSSDEIPLGAAETPIIPLHSLMDVAPRLPHGAVLVVVRTDVPSRPFRVTHLGFIVEKNGRPHLRHAARATYMSVIDEDLATFVRRNAGYRSWPVEGFHIVLPQENQQRAATLARQPEGGR